MFHSLYNQAAGQPTATPDAPPKSVDSTFLNWPASYLDGFQDADIEHWTLEITGLVEKPQTFTMKDFNSFTRIQQNRRLVFADGYTYKATWEGFVVQELLHRVSPKPEAQFLWQTNLSGQTECIAIKDLYNQRALFGMRVNGKSLPALYGGPLRLLVFDRYAHKGLGQVVRLTLSDEEIPGYFASKGYAPNGQIEPGA